MDIGLVSVLLFQVYKLIRGSIAVNIFLGILALYLVYLIVRAAQMELLSTILGQFMGVGVLAMIILFCWRLAIVNSISIDHMKFLRNMEEQD